MNPLPPEAYVFKYEKLFTEGSSYHVQIGKERHFYSIPYLCVGKKAKAVYDCHTVEIWVDLERVAIHRRSFTDGYTTDPSHMSPNHIEKNALVIFDDFGLQPLDDNSRLALLQILEDCYERKSVIITSQLPIAKWYDYIKEPTLADAIMDRLTANARRIDLKGQSLRRKSK